MIEFLRRCCSAGSTAAGAGPLPAAALATLAVLGAAVMPVAPGRAQSGPTVRIEFQGDETLAGERFEVFVYVEGASGLAGFNAAVTYDETYVSYLGAEIGEAFLGSGGRTVVPLGPDPQPGRVVLGAVTLPGAGAAGANGDGDLAVLDFRALAAGEAVFGLRQVQLVDVAGSTVEVEGVGGTVRIAAGASPTPVAATSTPPALTRHAYLPWAGQRR